MLGHHLPEPLDLGVQHGDERDLAGHDRGVGVLHRVRSSQLGCGQHFPDRLGAGGHVAPVRGGQGADDLGPGQPGGGVRVRCLGQQDERVRLVQVLERGQGRGEEVP